MEPVLCKVADLGVRHFGCLVATNGYQGELISLGVAEDPFYIEVVLGSESEGVRTWVKPDAPCRIEPPC